MIDTCPRDRDIDQCKRSISNLEIELQTAKRDIEYLEDQIKAVIKRFNELDSQFTRHQNAEEN